MNHDSIPHHWRSDGSGLVVLCAANNWDDVKLADRHLAESLAEHVPMLYVDPPMSYLTPRNRPELSSALRGPRLRLVAPNVARLTPVMPPRGQRRGLAHLTNTIVRRTLQRAVRRLGGRVDAVVTTWLLLDVYGACNEARRVYWWQDDPVSAAELWGIESSRMLEGERRLAAGADLVVVANERAVGRWNGVAKSVRYIPYGCDAGGFAATGDLAPPGDVSLPAPVAGFVGHLNRRTDLALLDAVAERGISLLLIGPRDPEFEPERTEALLARTNVAWIGARPFEELPSYLGLVDVGLVPYAPTDFNQWSFPLKTLEYISAGLPVVATSLPATRSLATDLVTLADEPEAFADAVERVLPSAHDPALVVRRRQFAAVHSWRNRAAEFATALELPQTRS